MHMLGHSAEGSGGKRNSEGMAWRGVAAAAPCRFFGFGRYAWIGLISKITPTGPVTIGSYGSLHPRSCRGCFKCRVKEAWTFPGQEMDTVIALIE